MKYLLLFTVILCSLLSLSLDATQYECKIKATDGNADETFQADKDKDAVTKCLDLLNEHKGQSSGQLTKVSAFGIRIPIGNFSVGNE